MKPENQDGNFDRHVYQLLQLLKKMMKDLPSQGVSFPDIGALPKGTNVNLNLCFFTFLPLLPEEMAEFEDAFEQFYAPDFPRASRDQRLHPDDLEFLRKNGIQF
ncbi:MAG: hypothetical protein HYZ85_00845 [Candidatus Omnitrophica bacterium]|nr:hypothetical protein [Candidatus Omnitrophota bacterium]